jgi:hypothetical protein
VRKGAGKVSANTETMNRIGEWFGRRTSTAWSVKEAAALKAVDPSAEELTEMEDYYTAPMQADKDYRRRDVLTLLNNWTGELDRARGRRDSDPYAALMNHKPVGLASERVI